MSSLSKFKAGQRWHSKFINDSFFVYDVFPKEERIRVLWDSNKNYIADVWSHDVRPLQLVKER